MTERRLIPVLPTLLTLGNLACGFIAMAALVDALQFAAEKGGPFDPRFVDRVVYAAWFIVAAMVFDALDGRVARLTGQTSAFGTQLDSLADMSSFGIAPALMAKVTYEHTMDQLGLRWHPGLVTLLCSLFLMGAALRLARFTIATDTDAASHQTFLGLPSPAAAGMVISTIFLVFRGLAELGFDHETVEFLGVWTLRALPGIAAFLGLLMISQIRYVHVFQRYVKTRTKVSSLVRMVLLAWLVVMFHEWLLFTGSLIYVLGGIVLWMRARGRGESPADALPAPWDDDDEEHAPA